MTTLSRLVKIGLHVYGIWPYVPSTVVFKLYWIIMLSTAQVFQYWHVVINIHMDDYIYGRIRTPSNIYAVSSIMRYSLLYIKFVILWKLHFRSCCIFKESSNIVRGRKLDNAEGEMVISQLFYQAIVDDIMT